MINLMLIYGANVSLLCIASEILGKQKQLIFVSIWTIYFESLIQTTEAIRAETISWLIVNDWVHIQAKMPNICTN